MSHIKPNLLTMFDVNVENTFSNLTVLSAGLGQDSHAILYKIVFEPEFKKKYAAGRLLVLFADTEMNMSTHIDT